MIAAPFNSRLIRAIAILAIAFSFASEPIVLAQTELPQLTDDTSQRLEADWLIQRIDRPARVYQGENEK